MERIKIIERRGTRVLGPLEMEFLIALEERLCQIPQDQRESVIRAIGGAVLTMFQLEQWTLPTTEPIQSVVNGTGEEGAC